MSDPNSALQCDGHFQPEREQDFLYVESQQLAIVDLKRVDDIVEVSRPYFTGDEWLEGGFLVLEYGAVCSTQWEAGFGYLAHAKGGAIHAFEMVFADEDDTFETSHWYRAGTFESSSGILVIGDPGQLEDYVEDPFERPFESFELWALAALPGPGTIAVDVQVGQEGSNPSVNIGMRWEWVGAPADTDWRRRVTREPI